jgi:thiol-disulfide isomerase/thioredoxin
MKHLILFLSFIIVSDTVSAQKNTVICGKVNSAQAFTVNIYLPVNGYYNLGHKYIVGPEIGPVTYIEDKKFREDLWAMYMLELFYATCGKYNSTIIDQYCSIFPENKWERFLRRQLADFPVPDKITYTLQSPVKYIDSTKNIKRFDALLKELPQGKAVFVDCWAIWCSPCVSAFTFNKPLDSLLQANHIERLYISIDNPHSREKWEKAVDKYCLGGYHILADNDLIIDIKKICCIPQPEKSPIAIPSYLLVD